MAQNNDAISVFEKHRLAFDMVKAGFRTSIVYIHTQLSKILLRKLYKTLHHKSPSSGLLPSSAYVLSNRKNQIYATLFMRIYAKLHKDIENAIDVKLVMDSWDIYKLLVPKHADAELDIHPRSINEAWALTRDFRASTNYFANCRKCNQQYLACDDSRLARKCPFCNTGNI